MRAPQNWHQKAIKAAYSSGDKEWMLTAVFLEDVLQIADPKQFQSFLFFSETNSDAGFTNSGWS